MGVQAVDTLNSAWLILWNLAEGKKELHQHFTQKAEGRIVIYPDSPGFSQSLKFVLFQTLTPALWREKKILICWRTIEKTWDAIIDIVWSVQRH
jgi:hypothetical protein